MTRLAPPRATPLRFLPIAVVGISVALLVPCRAVQAQRQSGRSLKRAADGLFEIGVGVGIGVTQRPGDWNLLSTQFSYVAFENCMKPGGVQPAQGEFRFDRADAFVDFCEKQKLKVVGHCLVWAKDDRTPPWFYKDGDRDASRELLLERMRTHIETVAGRYRGRIAAWDVVNEALADEADAYLRPSGWSKACGEDFILQAFRYARAAAPDATLIYNDYRSELPGKREKLLRLVSSLKEKNAPIDVVGLQGHYELDSVPYEDLRVALSAMRELGVKVVVSELDIDVVKRGRWWAEGGKYRDELAKYDPYNDGCPPEILQRQAEQYAKLFELFCRYSDVIERISFWNLHDGQSWLNDFPWKRVNHPLLFDRQGRPKPAFDAVVEVLLQSPRP